LGRFIRGPDDDSKVVVETCSAEAVDYNKSVVFNCRLYVCIVISDTPGCFALVGTKADGV